MGDQNVQGVVFQAFRMGAGDRWTERLLQDTVVIATSKLGTVAQFITHETIPPAEVLAEAIMPLLAMAEALGYDLLGEAERKARLEIERAQREPALVSTSKGEGG